MTEAYRWTRFVVLSLGICSLAASPGWAAPKASTLLPQTTKSYVSIPDLAQAQKNFDQTQIGQMMADPAMKPFTQDLRGQIEQKLLAGGVKLGITLDDLKGVRSGEVCFATIQPDGPKSDAVVLLVDVTGKNAEVNKLLEKIAANQVQKGARRSQVAVGNVNATRLDLPVKQGETGPEVAFYAVHQDVLVATDSPAILAYILSGISNPPQNSLITHPVFEAVLARAQKGQQSETYDFEWFIEPFGYAEVARSQQGGRKKRGTDMLQLLRNQGFDAIQGIGGYVNFLVPAQGGNLEMVHSSFVYAPTDSQAQEGQRFRLGARVLSFPNAESFKPYDWVPAQLATFLDFRWNVQDAFHFSETIVNEYADDEIFVELIESLEKDPAGPKVNIVDSIVQHLGTEVAMVVDVEQPITPQSEQRMLAIRLLNAAPVKAAVTKIMSQDPNAEKHPVGEEEIWEIHEEQEEIPTLTITGPGPLGMYAQILPRDENENAEPLVPNAAVAVVDDWLYFANNKSLIRKVIETKRSGGNLLANDAAYQKVEGALKTLGAGSDSFRHFVNSDQATQVTYELLRQGKMPESESAIGRVLNELWRVGEEENPQLREQKIDAAKLPAFQQVEKYFGPSGTFARTEDNGWYASGAMLKK